MNILPSGLGRIRRKTYYNVNLINTIGDSGFAFLGDAVGAGPGVLAGILRPVRADSGPDYGSTLPASFAEGADRDMYGNLLPSNAAPIAGSPERRGRERITAIFECAETDVNTGEPAHACIQFIAPTTAALALSVVASPALLDPSIETRPFLRLLFFPGAGGPGARIYLQKQHSWEA